MTARIIPVDPFELVVFGGTGDLALRKLMPALYFRFKDGQIPPNSRIIGTSRSELEREAYIDSIRQALTRYIAANELDPEVVDAFCQRLDYVPLNAMGDSGWERLEVALSDGELVRVFYLSTSPDLFGSICHHLGAAGLVTPGARVVLEKPIGKDLASAQRINDEVGAIFPENQIYRIDHYLGKETVQNLMALRFANFLFEPLWSASAIDHVQITVAESIGVEGRGGYYDTSGALRDMVQNHLLQLLCLVAMEPSKSLDKDAVRNEKLKVLSALKPITGGDVASNTVRGQYTAGAAGGAPVPGYLEEIGKESSTTETFVAIKAEVENWRWGGVPFYLRTGKRMPVRASEIVIQFRQIPHSMFAPEAGEIQANRLIIRLQPDESVKLLMMTKDPGPGGMRLRAAPLNLSYAEVFRSRYPDAYERLLMDVVRGNPTLFMRRDEVEAAWHWVEPILEGWQERNLVPRSYIAGTWGPSASVTLIGRDGRAWYEDDD